jgi:hypothetical protein
MGVMQEIKGLPVKPRAGKTGWKMRELLVEGCDLGPLPSWELREFLSHLRISLKRPNYPTYKGFHNFLPLLQGN